MFRLGQNLEKLCVVKLLTDCNHTNANSLGHVMHTLIPHLEDNIGLLKNTLASCPAPINPAATTTSVPRPPVALAWRAPARVTSPPPKSKTRPAVMPDEQDQSQVSILPLDPVPMLRPSPTRPPTPASINTDHDKAFQLHNSHFCPGLYSNHPVSANTRPRSAYKSFPQNNPNLRVPHASRTSPVHIVPPPCPTAVKLGLIVLPCHPDRDCCACKLRPNHFDITTLANAPYHCEFDKGVDPLTSTMLAAIGYSNIGSEDVVACHNGIIDTQRQVLQLWHLPTANTFGPHVNLILQKSFKPFPVLESMLIKDVIKFYDWLQEMASDHLLAFMPFDAIMLRIGFEGLCVLGLGVHCYMRMGKTLMDSSCSSSLVPSLHRSTLLLPLSAMSPIMGMTISGVFLSCWCQALIQSSRFKSRSGWIMTMCSGLHKPTLNFHFDDCTHSSIFLQAIQFTDYADTVTTLQAQVNTYREFNEGYIPSHLHLHGLATSIHQNAMARLREITTP
jgi:hypothetical protein